MIASPVVGLILTGYAAFLVIGIFRQHMAARRLSELSSSWENRVSSLRAVRSYELLQIAGGPAHTPQEGNQGPGCDIFQVIGGFEGLDRLQHNGMILAALARDAQEFSLEHDSNTIERLEQQALSLNRKALLVRVLRSSRLTRHADKRYIRDIARLYCEMVSETIMFYTITHISRRERLIAACNW